MTRILLIAGDPSGDIHAATLARALKTKRPDLDIWAVGGPSLQKTADRFLKNIVDDCVVGFWEPAKKLPFFVRLMNETIRPVLQEAKPDVVIPVDFFGFNRLVARHAKQSGCKVLYYIGPQVWASRPGRLKVIRRIVDKMLVIFPFEKPVYEAEGIPAEFVGHPLLETIAEIPVDSPAEGNGRTVGLLPGSRPDEIRRHLPLFLKAAERIAAEEPEIRFLLFMAPTLPDTVYESVLAGAGEISKKVRALRDEDYLQRRKCDWTITCSGTATLENALLGLPMVVVYRMSWITYWIARMIVRVSWIALPNILAGRAVVPEMIQGGATPESIARTGLDWIRSAQTRFTVREELLALRPRLGSSGGARKAEDVVLDFLKGQ
ncbi:MAG TPA: lipid-A-disaccharide synthase [Elusimicrobiota bacterium]|nr:lipid-A-disaccharide synthase [Elusimicrobiota bacterium]